MNADVVIALVVGGIGGTLLGGLAAVRSAVPAIRKLRAQRWQLRSALLAAKSDLLFNEGGRSIDQVDDALFDTCPHCDGQCTCYEDDRR